ncbi:hypothetical protein B0H11DRAFT_2047404, partial [Mycena galericulata]
MLFLLFRFHFLVRCFFAFVDFSPSPELCRPRSALCQRRHLRSFTPGGASSFRSFDAESVAALAARVGPTAKMINLCRLRPSGAIPPSFQNHWGAY